MRRWPCALALLLAAASPLPAQDFPNKPVRVIASSSAGGISDIFIRIVGEELHKKWGQPLVVENRPGGQFNIGAKACAVGCSNSTAQPSFGTELDVVKTEWPSVSVPDASACPFGVISAATCGKVERSLAISGPLVEDASTWPRWSTT